MEFWCCSFLRHAVDLTVKCKIKILKSSWGDRFISRWSQTEGDEHKAYYGIAGEENLLIRNGEVGLLEEVIPGVIQVKEKRSLLFRQMGMLVV